MSNKDIQAVSAKFFAQQSTLSIKATQAETPNAVLYSVHDSQWDSTRFVVLDRDGLRLLSQDDSSRSWTEARRAYDRHA